MLASAVRVSPLSVGLPHKLDATRRLKLAADRADPPPDARPDKIGNAGSGT